MLGATVADILVFRARSMFNSLTRGVACPDNTRRIRDTSGRPDTYWRLATVPSLGLQLNTERYWFIKLGMIYQFKTSQICPPAPGDISPVRQHFKLQRKFLTFKGHGVRRWFLLYRVSVYHFNTDPGQSRDNYFLEIKQKDCTAKNHKKLDSNILNVDLRESGGIE